MLAIFVSGAIIATAHMLGRSSLPYQELYQYQLRKLAVSRAENIVVGDSSAGNAIDARLFSELSGRPTINIALTGAYGYAGTYNMIVRALQNNPVRNVVIMQTAGMMSRELSDRAYMMTARPSDLGYFRYTTYFIGDNFNLTELYESAKSLVRLMRGKQRRSGYIPPDIDYVRQGKPQVPSAVTSGWNPDRVRPEKIKYLHKIVSLCRSRSLNCFYVHGPLANPRCSLSTAYFARANALIQRTGIRIVQGTPLCMEREEVGNTSDHVHPEKKRDYTVRYFRAMANELAPASGKATR